MSHYNIVVSKHTLQQRILPSSDGYSQWTCIVNSLKSVIIKPIWGFYQNLFRFQSKAQAQDQTKKRHSDPPPPRIRGGSIPKRTSSTNLMAECNDGTSVSMMDLGYEPDQDVEMQRRLSDPNYDTLNEKYRIFRDSPTMDQLEESAIMVHPTNNRPFYSKREIALYKATLVRCSTCKIVIPVGCEILCEQNERFCTDRCLKRWRFKTVSQAYQK